MKIALDIDGTINASKESLEFFRVITHLLHPDLEHYIVILTNREPNTEQLIADELGEYGIQYNEIKITANKAQYIKDNKITVFFENEDEYHRSCGPDVLVLKVKECHNFSFAERKWITSRQNSILTDE